MNVRSATEAEAAEAAALHADRIDEGFLPSLGARFLRRLYRRMIRVDGSFVVVAEDTGSIAGFAAATEDLSALYRSFILRDGVVAAVVALPRAVRAVPRVVETLRYPGQRGSGAELLAVAVARGHEGRGVGAALVGAVLAELRRRGVTEARVVAGADNTAALRLYERCGFRPHRTFEVHRGVTSKELLWR